jgi:hypothetical protein
MLKLAVISRRYDGRYAATLWHGRKPVAWACEFWPELRWQLRELGLALASGGQAANGSHPCLGQPLIPIARVCKGDVGRCALAKHEPARGHPKNPGDSRELPQFGQTFPPL